MAKPKFEETSDYYKILNQSAYGIMINHKYPETVTTSIPIDKPADLYDSTFPTKELHDKSFSYTGLDHYLQLSKTLPYDDVFATESNFQEFINFLKTMPEEKGQDVVVLDSWADIHHHTLSDDLVFKGIDTFQKTRSNKNVSHTSKSSGRVSAAAIELNKKRTTRSKNRARNKRARKARKVIR